MSTRPRPTRGLTARRVFDEFLRVPSQGSRALRALAFHPAQQALIDAYDERGADGLPRYTEVAALWLKKAGKSTTGGGLVLAELLGNTSEPDREVIIVASDWEQSKTVIFASAARFVRRHPWLSKHFRVLASELIYKETVTDQRTGGKHIEEHIARAVPARDARSLHGTNATLTVFDEVWAFNDYSAVEALARSAARKCPRIAYFSYAGLRSQQRAGVPLWDLWLRWKANDPSLFVSYLGGEDGWRSVPWITERFIDQQRRQFAAVPAKFRRLWLNEWATGDEDAFLSADEIRDATDPAMVEAVRGEPGIEYALGVDLGLTSDYSAAVVTHLEPNDGRLVVDCVRHWVGTKAAPVSLVQVEEELVSLARRFPLRKVVIDQWQGALLAERLRARGVRPVEVVTLESSRLDQQATQLKSLFSNRQIRIPTHPVLVEQLETIVGEELKRRDRIRFTQGDGQHDDLVVALCLSAEPHARYVGRRGLPATFTECWRAQSVPNFSPLSCYLLGGDYFPSGCPSCTACRGHQAVKLAARVHGEMTGQETGLREFYAERMDGSRNEFVSRLRFERWMTEADW